MAGPTKRRLPATAEAAAPHPTPLRRSATGWPHGRREENLEPPPELEGDAAVVGVTMARPSPTQVVLVVVSTEPDRAREQLGVRYQSRLCVVASRWTRAQVQEVQAQMQTRMGGWQIYQTGQTVGEDFQIRFEVEAVQVVAKFAEWASTVPDGLLQVQAWLFPTPSAEPPPP